MCENISIFGFHIDGGYAQYMLVPPEAIRAGCVNILPEKVSFEEGALAEPLACCINAQQLSRVEAGDSVVVVGAGPVGCMNALLSKLKGAYPVVLIDKNRRRLSMARIANADHYLLAETKVVEDVIEITEGGADVVILACRDPKAQVQAVEMVRKMGRVCLFSGVPSVVEMNTNLLHHKQIRLIGAYGCTSLQNKQAIELIERIRLKDLITHHFPLERVLDGFEVVSKCEGMKVIVG